MDTQAELAALVAETRQKTASLVDSLAEGVLDVAGFEYAMNVLLLSGHVRAAVLGRYRAGDFTPHSTTDLRFAQAVMGQKTDEGTEAWFLGSFADDLKGDRYRDEAGDLRDDAVKQRAGLYAGALSGTANRAWLLSLSAETLLYWVLGDEINHCPDCPELAENGPYTVETIPTLPGENETACLWGCGCRIFLADGQSSFSTVQT